MKIGEGQVKFCYFFASLDVEWPYWEKPTCLPGN